MNELNLAPYLSTESSKGETGWSRMHLKCIRAVERPRKDARAGVHHGDNSPAKDGK